MMADSRCFVDTNVLLAGTDTSRIHHDAAISFLEQGLSGQQRLFGSGQVFREYLVVATRPTKDNGLGLSTTAALENLREFNRCIQILDENADVAARLSALVKKHKLKGKRIHDANIVATMQAHGLTRIRTDNPGDFKVFTDIAMEPVRSD